TASALVWEMYPALRKIYKDDNQLVQSLNTHFKYYNCMPWLSPLITGATLAMEEKDGEKSLEAVQGLKAGLMGPLSGIGDTVVWVMLPTILGAIAASMGQQGNPIGMWLFALIYFSFFILRFSMYFIGYKSGANLVTSLGSKLSAFTDAVSVLGITVIGSIIATTIEANVGWTFQNSGVEVNLQEILDEISPSLLPAVLVAILYYLLKKKQVKMFKLILLVIAIAMAGAAIGLFES
ncbi:MAG: PTS system mannose/fructose/sorbose family transporter subunit IID, partial [Atopostipes sp.]|nr:PTS system mannose/fructose/sorbose family transporter subunit IID [Atopostipes sp.]